MSLYRCVGRVISRIGDFVCMCVCALKEKRLQLSTPNLAVARHACIDPARDQKVKGQGHAVIECASSVAIYLQIHI